MLRATEGSDVQQLVAERTGEGRPVRVTPRTEGTASRALVAAKEHVPRSERFGVTGVVDAELRAGVS